MRWRTERTDEFQEWWETLSNPDQRQVAAAIDDLEVAGPGGGRPLIDSVKGSRHSNLKELRATSTIRVFFAFDPSRVAVLLVGGNKAGKTKRFYREMISRADRIYDAHLRRITKGATENGRS